jgi:hypothetical protein
VEAITLNFDDLQPIEVPFNYLGKKYVMKEASGDTGCKYRNRLLNSTRMSGEGKPIGFTNYADVEPYLVSLCVFERVDSNDKSKDKPVKEAEVRSWQNRVVKELHEKIIKISDLQDQPETIEEIDKQIKELEHRKGVLKGDIKEGESYDSSTRSPGENAKNEQSATMDGSTMPRN